MAGSNKIFDVYISHAASDVGLAKTIASECSLSGLSAFIGAGSGERFADALWDALSESKAMIAILSPSGPPPSMAIEIGAARAWTKPIFGVLTDPTMKPNIVGLEGIHLYTASRIDDVIGAIKRSRERFSDNDRDVLAALYADTEVSVDQLAFDPRHLDGLVKRFARRTGKIVSGEQLLSELLRMRKQGRLRKSGAIGRAKRLTRTD